MGRKPARAEKGHGTGQHAKCSVLLELSPRPGQVSPFSPVIGATLTHGHKDTDDGSGDC